MATYLENSCSFGLRYVSWYKYLIVSLAFSHLGFWSGNLFLIAPFPDLCLLVPFHRYRFPCKIYVFLLQKELFHLKFVISAMTLVLSKFFRFLDGDVPRHAAYGVYLS